MRLKYYLKGLGIGLIVAALLMGIATREPATMTDEEIKIRAKELGMVEQKTLADTIKPTIEPEKTKEPPKETEAPTKVPVVTEAPVVTEVPVVTDAPVVTQTPVVTEAPATEPVNTETPNDTKEAVIFEIQKGESSDTISEKLEEMGLVENAVSYNQYLCDKGYDRKLNIGTYQLKIGMTEEEIAKIITRTR